MHLKSIPIHTPSPLEYLISPILEEKNIQLWIKRDDLTHPLIQGNKWRKLKYNLSEFKKSQTKYLLTFGGAYSNHIYATAAAGQLYGIPTIGIVRGEKILPLNSTLAFAKGAGMQLHFVDRKTYRLKEKLLPSLNIPLKDCYILPEGGTNELAIKGCEELGKEILDQMESPPDFVIVSCGTGGTMAGLISSFQPPTKLLGFSSLKGNFLTKEIQNLLDQFSPKKNYSTYTIQTDYHFGGYAKHTPILLDFINDFKKQHHIQLDPIYTGKMFYGIFDLIGKDFFPFGSKIVAIHTGGLQGLAGFRERFGELI